MSPAFDLRQQAAAFANDLSVLINRTVGNGVRLSAVVSKPGRAVVGYGVTKRDLDPRRGIPLTLGRRVPAAYLGVSYRLQSDPEGEYLAVTSSVAGIFADAGLSRELLHYDYEREKPGYPEAHLQVAAEPAVWAEIGPRGRPFARAHLPVGGRRYRPTLEELVEFAIVEEITEGRRGWESAVAAGRERFRVRQLRAAIRRDPATAREVHAEIDR